MKRSVNKIHLTRNCIKIAAEVLEKVTIDELESLWDTSQSNSFLLLFKLFDNFFLNVKHKRLQSVYFYIKNGTRNRPAVVGSIKNVFSWKGNYLSGPNYFIRASFKTLQDLNSKVKSNLPHSPFEF